MVNLEGPTYQASPLGLAEMEKDNFFRRATFETKIILAKKVHKSQQSEFATKQR